MIIASCFIAVILAGCGVINKPTTSNNNLGGNKNVLSMEEAKTKALDFIDKNLLQAGTTAEFKSITEENGLYKLVIDVGDSKGIESYITKDGTKFIPSMMDIKEVEDKNSQAKAQVAETPPQDIAKNDKPEVELFVMSYCPYGTQIEKGILPVLDAIGSKIDFKLKFCDYAMHDKKELDEQVREYCVQKNEPDKFNDYLKCFLDNADFEGCITKSNINNETLQPCIDSTDKEYKVTENYGNKDTWKGNYPPFDVYKGDNTKYGVQGSPSLVINGAKVSAQRDSASLLSTICSAFTTPPEECSTALSSTPPAPGFGFDGAGSASTGSCN